MAVPKFTKFNGYAESYNDLHKESTHIAGEDPDYFAAYKVAYMVNYLREHQVKPSAILDFGCGVGNCLAHIIPAFPEAIVHGMDVSGASIEVARKAFPAASLSVIHERLPLADASIDVAIAVGVFHHIPPDERAKWMDELHRVMRPEGLMFVSEHNPYNPVTQYIVKHCEFDDDAVLLTANESMGLLRKAGFSNPSTDYVLFFPGALAAMRPMERWLKWVPLGAQYMSCARA